MKVKEKVMTPAPPTELLSRGVRPAVPFLGVLLLWLVFTRGPLAISEQLLPAPESVLETAWRLVRQPFAGSTLVEHILSSVNRWTRGFLMAVVVGIPFGVAIGWNQTFRAAVMPVFEVIRYIPPFAWIPIMIVWFGASTTAQAAVVFIACFPPLVLNSERGIVDVDAVLYRASRNLGARTWATLKRVAVPTGMPTIVTGMRIALSNGWMALMAAELIVGKQGLGYLIIAGQENGNTSVIIVGMIMIGLVGVCADWVVRGSSRRLTRWRKGIEAHA